jgi:hypothetical protein
MRYFILSAFLLFGSVGTRAQELVVTNVQKIYPEVETKPKFKGDMNAWLIKNLRFAKPEDARGKVIVDFIIDTAGRVQGPIVRRDDTTKPLTATQKEVLRVVKKMPPWIPGRRKNGEIVPVKYSLPVILN